MSQPSGPPTLIDVAKAAGVSRATASRVLAGHPSVNAELASRVLSAASSLDYRANAAARILRGGASGSIAVVVPSSELDGLAGPFIGAPLRGVTTTLFANSRQPVLLLDDGRDPAPLLRFLTQRHVDGAVVMLVRESEGLFLQLADLPIPVVYVGRPREDLPPDVTSVDADNYGGARLGTRALLEAGRRRIATIHGPAHYAPAVERHRGFVDEHAEWGVEPGPVDRGEFTMPSGAAAAARLLQSGAFDGIFAQNDLMAAGALRVLADGGLRVPQDVSVVGFDDTVVASTASPPLTSVRQPLQEMGARAAELVLEAIADPSTAPQRVVLPMTLTLRESV